MRGRLFAANGDGSVIEQKFDTGLANGDKDGASRPPKKPRKAIASGVFGTLNPPPRKWLALQASEPSAHPIVSRHDLGDGTADAITAPE